jgi:hypothetical protein
MCQECESNYETRRGQAGRDAALRFARRLKQQGFLPTHHFAERFLQRVLARGLRFDPRTFRREFFAARHYRQTRPGFSTRIAVVRGVPVIYRRDGRTGERIVLVSVLSVGKQPPTAPVRAPSQEIMSETDPWSCSNWSPSAWSRLTYEQKKKLHRDCLDSYRALPGASNEGHHGSAFQRAAQHYLRCQCLDPHAPRYARGWQRQEQRRQSLAARQRAKGFLATGQGQIDARQAQLRAVAADKRQSPVARKWATDQLKRLARGQARLEKLKASQTLDKPPLRRDPGHHVGHPRGYILVNGELIPRKSLQDPRTFGREVAILNQSRPGIVRRFAKQRKYKPNWGWAYKESDPWA